MFRGRILWKCVEGALSSNSVGASIPLYTFFYDPQNQTVCACVWVSVRAYGCPCVRMGVRACVWVSVRACVRACVCVYVLPNKLCTSNMRACVQNTT